MKKLVCPKCGSDNVSTVGVFFIKDYMCEKCMHQWSRFSPFHKFWESRL